MKLRILTLAVLIVTPALFVGGCSSDDAGITNIDTTPPLAPVMLGARGDDGILGVWWENNSEADLAGYHVYAVENGTVARLTTHPTHSNSYVERRPAGGSVRVYVTAMDLTGNESGPSAERTVRLIGEDQIAGYPEVGGNIQDAQKN